ncbi:TolC family protein [Sunxiuqinia elliptica]|uniref:Outer membrane protein n=1 Tax=Sunxiuqinia elliptica TaxID=655355 RepID=A0A1I2ECE7_9BACT|nr:TolC family protein [Sunxiuqinia elliptica]TDO04688.1 outer membrane protein [Sunxiuqinia elliptica]TDO64236.1 outer membrane protein [Sunxiuqinia elliptica]SFE90138.1 outer membrane protein [Sunxiuqinia elliptica]
MKRLFQLTALLVLIFSGAVNAQQSWDLQRCVDYALENNIRIQQQDINSQYYENELQQAKNNRLPSVNGGLSNSFNFGRSLQYDNTYANYNSNQTGGSLSANMTLWNGFILQKSITKADLDLKAALADLQKAKDDISLYIVAAYLEILFAEELVQVAEAQTEVTKLQIERTGKLVDAGSLAKGSLLEIEAQLAREELDLVNQQNSLQLAYLNLYQLLELPSTEQFKIEKPVLPVVKANGSLLNSMEVFRQAVNLRPEIKSAEYRLGSYQEQVAIAKGSLYPTLTFGADYYNSYNNKYEDFNGDKISLNDQLKNNERYGLGVNLSIPIFNKGQVRTQIKNAELQVINQEYELQNTKNVLRKDIEQAYTNAVAALKKYMASNKAVESMQEAFRYTEEKFNVGMVNTVEYNQSKNNLTKAQSDLSQAKYDYIFRTKILDFYNGIPIQL